jgi:hypothetical protein
MKSGQGWDLVARNAEAAKRILSYFADIECVGIDFDMGGLCTGYDIMKWAWENHYLPAKVEIVSLNPVGRKAIENFLIHDAGYVLINNTYCRRN